MPTASTSPTNKNYFDTIRLILLDRDGVVNRDVGAPGVLKTSQIQLTRHAAKAISNFRQRGCKVALITNQSCVGKGLISDNDLTAIHNKLQQLLLDDDEGATIDSIFYCTSLRNSGDYRMKPNPGMVHEACELFSVKPEECIFIGDALRDLEAAASAGVQCRILVETGYGLGLMNGVKAPSPRDDFTKGEGEENSGIVAMVDEEYCAKFKCLSEVECDSNNDIFPFYYTKDLYAASSWFLQNN